MATVKVARFDSRSERTKRQLIEAAEALMARHGVDGVSMRQIGQAVGAANPHVVGYHFGSKDALVAAVILHRLPEIEHDRRQQLERLGQSVEEAPTDELVRILFRPLVEAPQFGRSDEYPRFLSAAAGSGYVAIWDAVCGQFDLTVRMIAAIRQRLGIHEAALSLRLRAASYLASAMLDFLREGEIADPALQGRLRRECLEQIVAVFCRPEPNAQAGAEAGADISRKDCR